MWFQAFRCVHVHDKHTHLCTGLSAEGRAQSPVFLSCSPPYPMRQSLPEPEAHQSNWTSCSGSSRALPLSASQFTDVLLLYLAFMWVLGIWQAL